MSISPTDIVFFKSLYINDTTANGGKIGVTRLTSGVNNNLFPNVISAERTSGVTRYRKFFIKNENPSNIVLENVKLFLSSINSGEDFFEFIFGDDTDIQSTITSEINWCGAGKLYNSVASGESSITVQFKQASGIFSGEANTQIRLSDTTHSEFHDISGVSWIGSNAVVTITDTLNSNFSTTDTVVSTVKLLDRLAPILSNWTVTSSAGTYNDSSYPISLYNIGTISEDWTITFTGATTFFVAGAVTGSVGTGTISSTFAPANGSSFYFSINKDGWGGTWATGDTVTFTTVHAAQAIWIKEIVPAGCPPASNNVIALTWEGESV